MIYTVTLNPSIDYAVRLGALKKGEINRAEASAIYPGGKGINVSIVLGRLGIKNTALGFAAGFTGKEIIRLLKQESCGSDFVFIENASSRINVKLLDGEETQINGEGPDISKEALEGFFQKLDGLREGDYIVLAGSVPKGLSENIYENILERIKDRGIKAVIDAEKALLLNTLKYSPFLVKPNEYELGEIFDTEIKDEENIVFYGGRLRNMGAANVLVSRGEKGAVLIDEYNRIHKIKAPKGRVVNTVGSGDSMAAGFLAGYIKSGDYAAALRLGAAAGSAGAFCEHLALREDIELLNEKYCKA